MKSSAVIFLCTLTVCLCTQPAEASAQFIRDTSDMHFNGNVSAAANAADTFPVYGESSGADSTGVWTLRKCLEYALEENISLQKSRIAAENARVDIKTAKGALFPSLSFATSQSVINRPYQENSTTVSGTEILQSNSNTSYSGNYGLNAQWTVYNGGRNRKTVKQEELNTRIAELDVNSTANNIMESIAQVYVQILFADESVKVNENTLEVSRAQCARGKELLDAGSISRADYAQLQAQVSNDNYQLVSSRATLQDYRLQLKQLLEIEGNEEMSVFLPEIDDALILAPLPDKETVFQNAMGIRPEIESGRLDISASELDVKIARSSYYPTLSLSAGIGTSHTSGTDFTFGEQIKNGWNNSVGLTLSVPIFNNRQTKSAVQKAELQLESTRLNFQETRKELYKTIENLWLDAYSAQQQYTAAAEQVMSAKTSFELVSEQFNLGMKNTVELLTEKNNLLSAEQQLLQAKYMAVLNIQLLRFYQGLEITL